MHGEDGCAQTQRKNPIYGRRAADRQAYRTVECACAIGARCEALIEDMLATIRRLEENLGKRPGPARDRPGLDTQVSPEPRRELGSYQETLTREED